jgi:integrase
MAHVQDRWERIVDGQRVRTNRYGQGKRWQARYLDPEGRERTRAFDRKQEADRFLTAVAADVLRGTYIDPQGGRVTFREFADAWLVAQTFTETTRETTELRLRVHASAHFGGHELRSIRPSVIQGWLRQLQDNLAPTYVRVVFANVSAVFNAAVDDGLIAANPCRAASVRLPKRDNRKVEPWPVEQVQAVIAALPERYRTTAIVAAGCGLRQGEVFGLRVVDVDFLRRRLHVQQQVKIVHSRLELDRPKGGKVRTVPLPETVAEAIAEHLRRYPAGDDGLVFTTREHNPINRNHFNRYIWRPALAAAGIEDSKGNGMHALRHFYASVLIDAGESVRAVADFLGHADPGFTLRVYAHLLPASEDRARKTVDSSLGRGRPVPRTGRRRASKSGSADWEQLELS